MEEVIRIDADRPTNRSPEEIIEAIANKLHELGAQPQDIGNMLALVFEFVYSVSNETDDEEPRETILN